MSISAEVLQKRLENARYKGASVILAVTNLPKEKAAARLAELRDNTQKVAGVRHAVRTKLASSLLEQLAPAA